MKDENLSVCDITFLILILCLMIGLILIIIFSFTGLHIEDNRGSQVGYITTVETNGLVFKTNSAYIKSNLESSQEERYCVIDEEVKNQLVQAMESDQKIKIYFYDWLFRGVNNCKISDLDIIYKIDVLGETK